MSPMPNNAMHITESQNILNSVLNSRYTGILYILIKLDIPELCKDKFQTAEELAIAANSRPEALKRIIETACALGIFEEKGTAFRLSPSGYPLLKKSENSVAHVILWIYEWKRKVWDHALYTVKTGKPAFDKVYGKSLFDFLAENPAAQKLFNQVMTQRTRTDAEGILNNYDFSDNKIIADIGGSTGFLLSEILKNHPKTEGILFDFKGVTDKANNYIKHSGLENRCRIISGDFFTNIPAEADLYLLKEVLHDWNDQKAKEILINCRKAMPQHAKLLIIEHLKDINNSASLLLDVSMMLTTGGKERTLEELSVLLNETGFKITNVHRAGQSLQMTECAKQ
jgi:hypothetical protein